jgi:predicted dehydrogenase
MTRGVGERFRSRVCDPMDALALNWGILGTGWIAERFVQAVLANTNQRVVGVGSRDGNRARHFAERTGLSKAYSSYEALVGDPLIDVVYVASTHDLHLYCAQLAMRAGKHVVVEKPLALNGDQAAEIVRVARDEQRFCMEALWTFFLPKFDVVRQLIESGVLGDLKTVLAEYGVYFGPDHRIMQLDLGGGPLLDLGTYPVSLATWALGAPERIDARGQDHPIGVNGQISAILQHTLNNQAVLHTTLFSNTVTAATIAGTDATLELCGPFFQPGELVLITAEGQREVVYKEPKVGHRALYFEAAEAARCIGNCQMESSIRPLADSVLTIEVMDEIRRQCGIHFPSEGDDSTHTAQRSVKEGGWVRKESWAAPAGD